MARRRLGRRARSTGWRAGGPSASSTSSSASPRGASARRTSALTQADLAAAEAARPGWNPAGWSIDGAARVLALLVYGRSGPFAEVFKHLRRTADAAELVALYRGLPLYPEPESLEFEVGEGLRRSNIRAVFEAIAHDNPYPREHFDEHRWNHMVLKALFVGSRLAPIEGLDARANPELARILHEYAHERWAAGRPVTPELWRCIGPFAAGDMALADLARARRQRRRRRARRRGAGALREPRRAAPPAARPPARRPGR